MRRSKQACGPWAWLIAAALGSCSSEQRVPEAAPPAAAEREHTAVSPPRAPARDSPDSVVDTHEDGSAGVRPPPELPPSQPAAALTPRLPDDHYGPIVAPAAIAPECQ